METPEATLCKDLFISVMQDNEDLQVHQSTTKKSVL